MKHLTQEQRYAIYLGLQNGRPIRKIAKEIGVSPSTVSRELKRNSKGTGGNGWIKAQQRADSHKRGKRAEDVARAACRALLPYKDSLKTITTDNGSEFARHGLISRRLGVPVFFTDAYSSWQKGAVENANKLVRFYLPKGTRLNGVRERKLMQIQMAITSRPRKNSISSRRKPFFSDTFANFAPSVAFDC